MRSAAAILATVVLLQLSLGAKPQAPATAKPKSTPKQSGASSSKTKKKPATTASARAKAPAKSSKKVVAKRSSSKSARTKRTASRSRKAAPRPKLVIQEPAVVGMQCAMGAPGRGEAMACVSCSEQALVRAHALVGLRYKRGGTSVETGFDCSGFVQHVFGSSCQFEVPRSASAQYQVGLDVPREELVRGDLVFFRSRRGWHVGIYTGDGGFIHSPNRRDSVKVSSLNSPYYRKTYLGARRLVRDLIDPLPAEVPVVSEVLTTDAGLN